MTYMPDDIVVTSDGRRHRILWECKGGLALYVKSATAHGKGYMVKVANITGHEKKVRA